MAGKRSKLEEIDWEGTGLRKAGYQFNLTLEQQGEWVKCAGDPVYFIEKYWKIVHPDRGAIPFTLRPFQKAAVLAYEKHRMIAMLCSRQVGKAISISTPILTPTGFRLMGDIHPGDLIYGPDGKKTRVLGESPIYDDHTCYKVTFDNKDEIVVDAAHLWTIGTITQVRIPGTYKLGPEVKKNEKVVKYRTLTTEEIIPILTQQKSKGQSVFIDATKPVEMEKKELPIDPYLLGLWIGDGTSSNGDLTALREDMRIYEERLPNETFIDKTEKREHLRLVKIEGLRTKLKENDLINNKHIPEVYLTSCFEDRLALLQGLIDTDGSVTPKGSTEFYTKCSRLAKQVQYLAASLGMKVQIRSKTISKIYTKDKVREYEFEPREYYTVRFLTTLPVATLPRKVERLQKALVSPDSQRHYIQSIEKVESVPVKCIKVDNESHLFLAGNSLIPTHNTSSTVAFIGWYIIFHSNSTVGVLADKQETAVEIHDRLKFGYENLPHWLKFGYEKWNVKSIKLENGSGVVVSATTPNAGRGRSFSIVFLDEFAAVKTSIAEKFKASILPTIASGTETKLFITSTPQGKNHFYKIIQDAESPGSNWHLIKADYRSDPARDTPEWRAAQIKELGLDQFRQEHECLWGPSTVNIKLPDGSIVTMSLSDLYEQLELQNSLETSL